MRPLLTATPTFFRIPASRISAPRRPRGGPAHVTTADAFTKSSVVIECRLGAGWSNGARDLLKTTCWEARAEQLEAASGLQAESEQSVSGNETQSQGSRLSAGPRLRAATHSRP